MKTGLAIPSFLLFTLTASAAWGQQTSGDHTMAGTQAKAKKLKKRRSPGGDVASGTGDVAKGAAKGVGDAAKGVGEGAANLATLHPVGAAESLGKGAGYAGKDVAVGTGKGTFKVAKGIGRGIKHLF